MPGIGPLMQLPVILGMTVGILVGLFALQSRGTATIAGLFGPVCALWFLALAALGIWHIAQAPEILAAFNPLAAARFLFTHGIPGLFVLGAVFLTVTGAEALIADHGPFRAQADPAGLAGLRLARADAQLSRPGRAGAGHAQ